MTVVLVACFSIMVEEIQNLIIFQEMIIEQQKVDNASAAVNICEFNRGISRQCPDKAFSRHRFSIQFPDTFEDSSPTILLCLK